MFAVQSSGKRYKLFAVGPPDCRGAFSPRGILKNGLWRNNIAFMIVHVCRWKTETRQTSPRDTSNRGLVFFRFSLLIKNSDQGFFLTFHPLKYDPWPSSSSSVICLLFWSSVFSGELLQQRRSVSQFACSSSFETFVFMCSLLEEFILRRCGSSPSTCWLAL